MTQYLTKAVTEEELIIMRFQLGLLPAHKRFPGPVVVRCDFCGSKHPIMKYSASQLSTGEVRQCWRWLACQACHSVIEANDYKQLSRRILGGLGIKHPSMVHTGIANAALMEFRTYAIELNPNETTPKTDGVPEGAEPTAP